MADPDARPQLERLLANPPEECRPVADLYRHSAADSALDRRLGGRGGASFVFCEELGLRVFDEDLDVGYGEIVPLDDEAEALLRLALLAHQEHPEAVEDYTERLCWAERRGPPRGPARS
jgi:hypothetical protein